MRFYTTCIVSEWFLQLEAIFSSKIKCRLYICWHCFWNAVGEKKNWNRQCIRKMAKILANMCIRKCIENDKRNSITSMLPIPLLLRMCIISMEGFHSTLRSYLHCLFFLLSEALSNMLLYSCTHTAQIKPLFQCICFQKVRILYSKLFWYCRCKQYILALVRGCIAMKILFLSLKL